MVLKEILKQMMASILHKKHCFWNSMFSFIKLFSSSLKLDICAWNNFDKISKHENSNNRF